MDVLETLVELFPKVDRRIIAATAREHKDDLEEAIRFIQDEVLYPDGESRWEAEEAPTSGKKEKYRDEVLEPLDIGTEDFERSVELAIEEKEQLKKAMAEVQELRIKASEAEEEVGKWQLKAALATEEYVSKAQELKERILRGRHQNDLRQAEICGEKAVLRTEIREADSRLGQVRKEWKSAMDLINGCKDALEVRLESAKQNANSAREEMLKKEQEACQGHAAQEDELSAVEARAKDLDRVAEECTRLREFLMKKGTAIDSLQGEIAVLVEDAQLLKAKIDGVAAGIYQDSFRMERSEQKLSVSVDDDYKDWQEIEKDVMKTIRGELDAERSHPKRLPVLTFSSYFPNRGTDGSEGTIIKYAVQEPITVEKTLSSGNPSRTRVTEEAGGSAGGSVVGKTAKGSAFYEDETSSYGSFDAISPDETGDWL